LWCTLTKDTSRISIPAPSCPLPYPALKNPPCRLRGHHPNQHRHQRQHLHQHQHMHTRPLYSATSAHHSHARGMPHSESLAFSTSTAVRASRCLCAPFRTAPTTTQPYGHACNALHPCSGITPLSTRTPTHMGQWTIHGRLGYHLRCSPCWSCAMDRGAGGEAAWEGRARRGAGAAPGGEVLWQLGTGSTGNPTGFQMAKDSELARRRCVFSLPSFHPQDLTN